MDRISFQFILNLESFCKNYDDKRKHWISNDNRQSIKINIFNRICLEIATEIRNLLQSASVIIFIWFFSLEFVQLKWCESIESVAPKSKSTFSHVLCKSFSYSFQQTNKYKQNTQLQWRKKKHNTAHTHSANDSCSVCHRHHRCHC